MAVSKEKKYREKHLKKNNAGSDKNNPEHFTKFLWNFFNLIRYYTLYILTT